MGRYAIVGFGCAGYNAAKELRRLQPEAHIDVYSNTADAPANPMLTTYYVSGKITREEVFPLGDKESIIRDLKIRFREKEAVRRVIPAERKVVTEKGEEVYDDIVLATGSHPLVPPIKGLPDKGIYVMRTVYDADRLLAAIQAGGVKSALVIGASWVGIKVVEALYAHGVPTVMADMAPRIFPTATLPETAEVIHAELEKKGIGLLFGKGIDSLREENGEIVSVFSDGTEVRTAIVALCLGLRPTVDYLDKSEIDMGRGVRVDRHQRSSVEHIYAVGDCCEAEEIVNHQLMSVNLWANATAQGKVAARNICGRNEEFQGNFIHNITHFLDMDFIGVGDNRAEGEHISYVSPDGWRFEMIEKDGKPVCVNIFENKRLSGPVKAVLLKKITTPAEKLGLDAAVALKQAGLPEEIINKIEGDNL